MDDLDNKIVPGSDWMDGQSGCDFVDLQSDGGQMYFLKSDDCYKDNMRPERTKDLGKHCGFCPGCGIMMGTAEIGKDCSRCGRPFRVN